VNIQEYIESGILEAYILGALTPDEEALVEANIAKIPELADELLAIEAAMQRFAATLAKEPPPGLQDQIWDSIQAGNTGKKDGEGKKARVIPLQPETAKRPMGWAYAAGLIALIGSVALNLYFFAQDRHTNARNFTLNKENLNLTWKVDTLEKQQDTLLQLVGNFRKEKNMMADTGMQTIVMHTVKPGHAMAATVYWSKNEGIAYVTVDGMPLPPRGMQYQLWVMQDGQPVDMGVISNDLPNTPIMQKIAKSVNSGQAFAISLEREGGSPTPTMTNIFVMGTAS